MSAGSVAFAVVGCLFWRRRRGDDSDGYNGHGGYSSSAGAPPGGGGGGNGPVKNSRRPSYFLWREKSVNISFTIPGGSSLFLGKKGSQQKGVDAQGPGQQQRQQQQQQPALVGGDPFTSYRPPALAGTGSGGGSPYSAFPSGQSSYGYPPPPSPPPTPGGVNGADVTVPSSLSCSVATGDAAAATSAGSSPHQGGFAGGGYRPSGAGGSCPLVREGSSLGGISASYAYGAPRRHLSRANSGIGDLRYSVHAVPLNG